MGITSNVYANYKSNTFKNHELEIIVKENSNKPILNYQIITEEELLNSLQQNNLESLLMKKGILIQRPSADSTLCRQSGVGGE